MYERFWCVRSTPLEIQIFLSCQNVESATTHYEKARQWGATEDEVTGYYVLGKDGKALSAEMPPPRPSVWEVVSPPFSRWESKNRRVRGFLEGVSC